MDLRPKQQALQSGDVIMTLNDIEITNIKQFHSRLIRWDHGAYVTLSYYRSHQVIESQVQIIIELKDMTLLGNVISDLLSGGVFDSIPSLDPRYGQVEGIYVLSVEIGSKAWHNGLRQGDIILLVNNQRVTTLDNFMSIAARQPTMILSILRDLSRLVLWVY